MGVSPRQFDPLTGMYTYSVGATNDPEELMALYQLVRELQFLNAEIFVLKEEDLLDLSVLSRSTTEELDQKKLWLNNILFGYKSAELDKVAKEVLNEVANLLSMDTGLAIVVEAHTDNIGSRNYNLELWQRRVESVVHYHVEQGVEANDLPAVGHGKNKSVADNSTEEGRILYRRVELRMVRTSAEHVWHPQR